MTLLWLLFGCAPRCPEDLPAIDYADGDSWICRPGRSDTCSEPLETWDVTRSPSVRVDSVPDPDAPVDCFYVYPTMDLRLRGGVHEDLTDDARFVDVTRIQAARLHEVCQVWVPLYRQVTIGTYTAPGRGEPCFDAAYADVEAAFDAYLAASDRPFALVGHSQGGQIVSRLVRERVETDPALLDRMVVALPIGWSVSTATDALVGGSFDTVPMCSELQQTGCAIGFRSYLEGRKLPGYVPALAEGDAIACANPADSGAGTGRTVLAASYFPADGQFTTVPDDVTAGADAFLEFEGGFSGQCVVDGNASGLEIAWVGNGESPLRERASITGINGTHLIDVHLTLGDLVQTVRTRGNAWFVAHP